MSEKVNHKSEFRCNICNKYYSSASSLCNHTKKFHTNNINQNQLLSTKNQPNINQHLYLQISKYNCRYCSKIYYKLQSRWKHEQKCKVITENKNNDCFYELKEKNKELENIIHNLQKQITEIVKIKGRVHHKTLQKFNNQVTNTINNTNTGTIINNTNVKFGDVSYEKIFSNQEILAILNKQYMALEEGINQVHFSDKLPEYNNIFITNLRDTVAYVFNGKEFITVK
jgi:hypothetical protein